MHEITNLHNQNSTTPEKRHKCILKDEDGVKEFYLNLTKSQIALLKCLTEETRWYNDELIVLDEVEYKTV